jgi:hypothetical protein
VLAGDFAEERLDADDGEQDLRRHANVGGPAQRLGLLAGGLDAARDAPLGEEARPVLVPGHGLFRRPADRGDDRRS